MKGSTKGWRGGRWCLPEKQAAHQASERTSVLVLEIGYIYSMINKSAAGETFVMQTMVFSITEFSLNMDVNVCFLRPSPS